MKRVRSLSSSMDVDANQFPLTASELDKFNSTMTKSSRSGNYHIGIANAGDNKEKWQEFFCEVVNSVSCTLFRLDLRNDFPILPEEHEAIVQSLNEDEFEEWKELVQKAMDSKDWSGLLIHPKLWINPENHLFHVQRKQIVNRIHSTERLGSAYNQEFIGDNPTRFLEYLKRADGDAKRTGLAPLYAKSISVVQSSGTGKSRMLTEVGRQIFTLPICLRKATDPGYPPGDEPVANYFWDLSLVTGRDYRSYAALIGVACFDCAAKTLMLELLRKTHNENNFNGLQLLKHWHEIMEPRGGRDGRQAFFKEVVNRANSMIASIDNGSVSPQNKSLEIYEKYVKGANEDLWKFISGVLPSQVSMWYIFMATKSDYVRYFSPSQMCSLRRRIEGSHLLPPYIDLGFDQQAINQARAAVTISMDEMQTTRFLSQCGRPMWKAYLPEKKENELIVLASWKLLDGKPFDMRDGEHVFAVLSQRLCLDSVLANSEAIELGYRSVGHHMRFLTGDPNNSKRSFTCSPSEPILVLGSFDILYNQSDENLLPRVLKTLKEDLCGPGLIEKGVLGELGVRTLLLTARDFAAPLIMLSSRREPLRPVHLLEFLYKLFHRNIFTGSKQLDKFQEAFCEAYVNFTHWILTQDPMPNEPDLMLLANLWARGGGLQCCFRQESIEMLIPIYVGSVSGNAQFDPFRLSAVIVQIKNNVSGDKRAEFAIRPTVIPRDPQCPLPYLTLLMELGNRSPYSENNSKVKCEASKHPPHEYKNLCRNLDNALNELDAYRRSPKSRADEKYTNEKLEELKTKVNNARMDRDFCNRFSISARGITRDVYGILVEAKIDYEFTTLMGMIMPPPTEENTRIKHMRPLDYLGAGSDYTDWISDYI